MNACVNVHTQILTHCNVLKSYNDDHLLLFHVGMMTLLEISYRSAGHNLRPEQFGE